jgi:PH (Pleckstrin Homology) domain-containing protein
MDVRPPAMPPAEGSEDAAGALRWGVPRRIIILKVAGAIVFVAIAVFSFGDQVQLAVAMVAALVLTALALRDLLAPVRVRADAEAVTVVTGFAGHRRLSWSEIDRVRVDGRTRFGLRSQLLEIDTGEDLYFFSWYDLGAPVVDVAQVLDNLRASRSPEARP